MISSTASVTLRINSASCEIVFPLIFDSFLKALTQSEQQEVITKGILYGISAFSLEAVASTEASGREESDMQLWIHSYRSSTWFGEVYSFLTEAPGAPTSTPVQLRKAYEYRVVRHIL